MTIKEISYKDERLEFFVDKRKAVQKQYDRLEKQIKPDVPYLSERRQLLDDYGRELSFYNDVIKMLENNVVPKSEVEDYKERYENAIREVEDWILTFNEARKEVAREIFGEIEKIIDANTHPIYFDEDEEDEEFEIGINYDAIEICKNLTELKKEYIDE